VNCPTPQVVSSEGTNQLVNGTVTDSSGSTATASVTRSIDETPPVLAISSPADGATISSATVTATGTLSDGLTGVASLTCNGTTVALSGSSFSCAISLNPGMNAIVVRATDTAGNIATSTIHVNSSIYPAPTSIKITPVNVSLAVGQTQQFTAIDNQGHPRPDATWKLPNRTTLATITSGSAPVLTAKAVGQVALTATVQGIPAQTTVNIVTSVGSTNWAIPSPGNVFTTVPTANGPSVISQDAANNLHAYSSDGQQLWQQQPLGQVVIPDASGGLLLSNPTYPGQDVSHGFNPGFVIDLDAQTGTPLWWNGVAARFDARPDGKLVGIGSDTQQQGPESVFVLDGSTGQRFDIPIPAQSVDVSDQIVDNPQCEPFSTSSLVAAAELGPITADTDGNAYFEYLVHNTKTTTVDPPGTGCSLGQYSQSMAGDYTLFLMTVLANGSTSNQELATRSFSRTTTGASSSSGGSFLVMGAVTPDGQGGVLAT